MADVTLTVSEELMARLNALAQAAGHSSGKEYAREILRREIERLAATGSDQKLEDRLRGLGYIS